MGYQKCRANGYAEVVTEFLKNSAIICIISTGEVEKHQMNTISTLYSNFSSQDFQYDCRFLQEFRSEKQMTL